MNDKFHKYLNKAGEEVCLTREERERMRRTLHAYMEMKPRRTTISIPAARTGALGWFLAPRPVAAILALALFVSSAGISYAARDSLPGDILYPIKTRVNEPVQGALARSDSAKAEWAIGVAGERIKEAAILAAENRLGTTTQRDLQANFREHARLAVQRIGEESGSRPESSAQVAISFEARLSEYRSVLTQIAETNNVNVESIAASVNTERDRVAEVRAEAESRITSDRARSRAAADMHIAARSALEAATKLASDVSRSLSSSSSRLVSVQLHSASTTISAGEDFMTRHEDSDATDAFQNALTATERLGIFLQTSSAIHHRTGLIVGESQKESNSENTQSKDKKDRNRGRVHSDVQDDAEISTEESSSGRSVEDSEEPETNSNENAVSETNTTTQKRSEDEKKRAETPGAQSDASGIPPVPTLPLSVPVHIPL
ncbi:MAG: DUF5667 domain-containing protein [Patescibacteria group bacterium]|nr:DUF5667 domain-containing protein [Patescibacteria group bacterium]